MGHPKDFSLVEFLFKVGKSFFKKTGPAINIRILFCQLNLNKAKEKKVVS